MRSPACACATIAIVSLIALRDARADEQKGEWYGWQTALASGLSVGAMVAGGAANSEELLVGGYVGYTVGPAIVHFGHGQLELGLASLALHALGPWAMSWGGAILTAPTGDERYVIVGSVVGFLLGAIAVPVIDAAFLAYEPPEDSEIVE